MKAVVIDRYGGPEELVFREVPTPELGDDEVLIKVSYTGIGEWDIYEREGDYEQLLARPSIFPYILGTEGSGEISDVGKNVDNFTVGDKVFGACFQNPKGGFYAEFVAIDATLVSLIPETLTAKEAATIFGVGWTALCGLEDVLKLKKEETIMIFGASGGVGHIAVQIAKTIGANVFSIASGKDGVDMVKKINAGTVVDGRKDNVLAAAREFVPEGFDAALFTAGGELADSLVNCIRDGGRATYPNGVDPIPKDKKNVKMTGYDVDSEPGNVRKFSERIQSGNWMVHIGGMYSLEDSKQAHSALASHYVGKLCLKVKD